MYSILEYYGIRGVAKQWFTSYLNNRKQAVIVNGAISDQFDILCGVPQGSVLGPLLFLLYINDFHCSSKFFQFHLFADDANLFCEDKHSSSLAAKVNTELKNVHSWLCANKLSLNVKKSSAVIFQPKQKRNASSDFNIVINTESLKINSCIKYLGIYIDSHLSWKDHIEFLVKKIKRNIGLLSKLRHYVNTVTLKNMYYSLIHPFVIYGIIAWGNTYETTLKPIFVLQKKALRIITFSSFDHPSSSLYKSLNIIKLPDLVKLTVAIFMYKYHNRLLPTAFQSFFTNVNKVHNYNTRLASKQSFYLPRARTNYAIFNIRFQGPRVWNLLKEDVKSLYLSGFKNAIKNTYINNY